MKNFKMNIKIMACMMICYSISHLTGQTAVALDDGLKNVECVTEANYQEFLKPILEQNISKLRSEGKINFENDAKLADGTVPLSWPLRMTGDYKDIDGVNDYFVITNFADLNHDEYYRLDWKCATYDNARNYDQHNGADILPYPYPWQMMEDESIDIVAAADGEVIYMYDGNFMDRNCDTPHIFNYEPFNAGYYGNFIALLHSDNSITVYAHMKNGTVANLEPGDNVEVGQYLGKLGSSGNSSAPHLHFEVRPCEACSYIEPWFDAGGCNDDVTESQWINQIPYSDTKILRVATHLTLPVFKSCAEYEAGDIEDPNFVNHFTSADNLFITAAIGDLKDDYPLQMDIINSAGTILNSQSYTSPYSLQYAQIVLFTQMLTGYSTGTYKIRITYNGEVAYHYFTVNCPAAATLTGVHTGVKGFINGDYIASNATISGVSTNNVFYQAENYIKLNVGFQATQNSKFHAQIDDCTVGGLREMEEETVYSDELILAPNPTFGIFSVNYNCSNLSDKKIVIQNVLGNIIYTSQTFSTTNDIAELIDLSNLPKGIYLVEIQQSGKSVTEQLVIQ